MLIHDMRGELKLVDNDGIVLWTSDTIIGARIEQRDGEPALVGYNGEDDAVILSS